MKLFQMFAAAGLVVASMGVGSVAEAQQYRGDRYGQNYRNDHGRRYDNRRSHYRDHRRGWRNDRHRVRCWTEWRHRHRVRVCR